MALDLIIFDCDGVLVDSESITSQTIVDAVGAVGLAWTFEDVVRGFRGGKMKDVMAQAEVELGHALPEDFTETFRAHLYERLASDVQAVPGVVPALAGLVHPFCVASNGPRRKMEVTLGATGLLPHFEGRIFTAYEVGAFKPAPDLFLHVAAHYGVEPGRCAVVEDSGGGVRAAEAARMHTIAYVGHGIPMETGNAHRLDDMAALPALLERIASA